MSSGTQIELDWAAIDAPQRGEGAAGAGARGNGANATSEPSTCRSDEEILGIDPPSPKRGYGGQARQNFDDGGLAGDGNTHAGVQTAGSPHTPANQTDAGDEKHTAPSAANDTEDLRAFREMFPGGAGEARALRQAAQETESLRASAAELQQAAQAVEQIDAAIFSGDARAQGEVVAELARANPAAFRQLFAEAARVLAGMSPASPNDFTTSARSEASRPGGVRNPSVGVADALEQQRDSSSSRPFDIQKSSQGKEAGTPRNDSGVGSSPSQNSGDGGQEGHEPRVASHQSPVTNHQSPVTGPTSGTTAGGPQFDPAAYASFERTTNDAVARDVRAAIGDTLARVLPDGVAEGAARRIGEDIFHEIHRALAADRALSEQVASLLRAPVATGQGWRFGAGEQQRIASLLAGRARQLVPSVARRVVGEWTSSVLGAAGAKAARQAAASSRVDIGAPGGVPDSMPLRPAAARGVNYAAMSDDEILSM